MKVVKKTKTSLPHWRHSECNRMEGLVSPTKENLHSMGAPAEMHDLRAQPSHRSGPTATIQHIRYTREKRVALARTPVRRTALQRVK